MKRSFRPHRLSALLLAALPLLAHANGAQPEGAICFYEHVNFQGASFCANADSNWIGASWNDRVSSVRIRDGASVDLFQDINYTGAKLTLNADSPNFVALNFNDQLSSYKVHDLPPLAVSSVELAQTHVIGPEGRSMQSANDAKNGGVKKLTLMADRAALLMVQPTSQVPNVLVRARIGSTILGPITLKSPGQLPATDAGRAPYSTVKYSALLPKEWLKQGVTLELAQNASFLKPVSVPLTVTPAITLRAYTVPLYMFGARPANSVVPDFTLNARNTNGYSLDAEYRQKLPISNLEYMVAGAITQDQVVLPPRNDAQYCYPALPVSSLADFWAAGGDLNARFYRILGDIHGATANRDGAFATGYYGFMQTLDGGKQVAASSGGGLGGGGSGVSGSDYRPELVYSAIFNHEMGHAYGLAHADSAYDSGDYPYPFGSKSGSTWGYDAIKNQLLSTLQIAGQSCDGRVVNNVCYQRTPMSGGDDDRDAGTYRWDTFADYQAAQMEQGLLDKVVADASYAGGYKHWNQNSNSYEPMDDRTRANIGTDVLARDQQVQTVIGSISHFNASPSASRMVVSGVWTGNLPKQIDPTVQADLDKINSTQPGGWFGYYCVNNGCDYTLVATYADGTAQRVLLPIGYHRFGYPVYSDNGYRASAQNPSDGDNLATYAVNLPVGHGGLSRVQVFNTPFGSRWQDHFGAIAAASLGSTYPLVNQWTPADGASGGVGAPGSSQFNSATCQQGAKVKYPAR
ncbi:M66 family metalloprotease [Amantichitinum ursilacus]|uniref:Dictomallein n=1 Tax=Amantichitinum ursilacus TaxID=857265 RepID=A0A0N0XFV9_9NEIS|nr:M66 family metalloprotease [Amantichitinum ursilacus]KPC49413.1 Metalloprotease StcE precursor [Amantichitinum ursilacus]